MAQASHAAITNQLIVLKEKLDKLLQTLHGKKHREIDQVLGRFLANKSPIDQWTSSWHDTSFLKKTILMGTVISLSGMVGACINLTLPLIAVTASIVFLVHQISMRHEAHRYEQGLTFIQETHALTTKLDNLFQTYQQSALQMKKILAQTLEACEAFTKTHQEMTTQTAVLQTQGETLQTTVFSTQTQSTQLQETQAKLNAAVESLVQQMHLSTPDEKVLLQETMRLNDLLTEFFSITNEMKTSQTHLHHVSEGLQTFMDHLTPSPRAQDAEFDNVMRLSQLSLVRANQQLKRSTPIDTPPFSPIVNM